MNERPARPTDDTVRDQFNASDPAASSWVAANAGSGKTHVLTQRVLRLLLTGVAPEAILCLTYTKAAASEMRARVSARLGTWALMDDAALTQELMDLERKNPTATQLKKARTLFALALETPGGLKINTIHAFCEAVLHRFPLEAGVPFGFQVIEDSQRAELIRQARETTIADGLEGKGPLVQVLDKIFASLSDSQINDAINEALSDMRRLTPILKDVTAAKQILRDLLGYDGTETPENLQEKIETQSVLVAGDCRELIAILEGDPKKRRFVDLIARAKNPDALTFDEMRAAFLTGKDEPRGSLMPKDAIQAAPALYDRFLDEQQRFCALFKRQAEILLIERSEAVLDLLKAIVAHYERQKRMRSLLDFDDLIERTISLLKDKAQAEWVRYKLDAGITHILVDESQDTNDQQWQVVSSLADGFFDEDDSHERSRSLFAVGDQKQSIFSFQGAQPQLFSETGQQYHAKTRVVGKLWHDIELKASFRTLEGVLSAVDHVFTDPSRSAALLATERGVNHESARTHEGGAVFIWPIVQQQTLSLDKSQWPMPNDVVGIKSATRENAENIANTITKWLAEQRPLGPRGRAITPDDILILVQSRNTGFKEVIRALKKNKIPSPGADRLAVSNHIAVLDLLTLGDVLLNPADDLGLAALLRSPLFDVSEDDLFELAHNRAGSLWSSLGRSEIETAKSAYAQLFAWRGRLDFERPYEFYANILYAQKGLQRFHGRLGEEVDDVLAEFLNLALDQERAEQPSLQGFLAQMRSRDISIKRELAETGGGVRVMTVHGAKGLEAPIVILADAADKPQGSQTTQVVYFGDTPRGGYFVHASGSKEQVEATQPLSDKEKTAQQQEYWRKLYVGMTRAEDELHICGTLGKRGKLDGTWYDAAQTSLGDKSIDYPLWDDQTATLYPANFVTAERGKLEKAVDTKLKSIPVFGTLPDEVTRKILTPSTVVEHNAVAPDGLQTHKEALSDLPRTADDARREGIALHALLQHLDRIDIEDRDHVAHLAMKVLLPKTPNRHTPLIEKVIRVLNNPDFVDIFGDKSRAEVPILAHGLRKGKPVKIVGRIDRLVISPSSVHIIDYKSDAQPPEHLDKIPSAYVGQLALYALVMQQLYPEKTVTTSILWTTTEVLMTLAPDALNKTTKEFTLE